MKRAIFDKQLLQPFQELITEGCGFVFGSERTKALENALHKRMQQQNITDLPAYLQKVRQQADELTALIELLTVNETYFMREPNHLHLLAEKLIPELLARNPLRKLQIMCAGCSTGEEAYSMAMLLQERFGKEAGRLFSITGVDIDSSVLAAASDGVYCKHSFRALDADLLQRYFEAENDYEYRINPEIKKQVKFLKANLLHPFNNGDIGLMDLILYRNVSIYFAEAVQKRIFTNLADQLHDGGILMVGATETLHHDFGILSLKERDSLFFFEKPLTRIYVDRRNLQRNPQQPDLHKKEPQNTSKTGVTGAETKVKAVADRQKTAAAKTVDLRLLFDRALELARSGNGEKAVTLLDEITRIDSSFTKADLLKAVLLLDSADYEKARLICNRLCQQEPFCREAYLILGIIGRQDGNDELAYKRFREALYIDPQCWLAHFYIAEILYNDRQLQHAARNYRNTVEILGNKQLAEPEHCFFPLSFDARQFMEICKHKLSLIKELA